jgi:hypothetical protein
MMKGDMEAWLLPLEDGARALLIAAPVTCFCLFVGIVLYSRTHRG